MVRKFQVEFLVEVVLRKDLKGRIKGCLRQRRQETGGTHRHRSRHLRGQKGNVRNNDVGESDLTTTLWDLREQKSNVRNNDVGESDLTT